MSGGKIDDVVHDIDWDQFDMFNGSLLTVGKHIRHLYQLTKGRHVTCLPDISPTLTTPRAFEFVFSVSIDNAHVSRIQYVIFVFMIFFLLYQSELNEKQRSVDYQSNNF